MAIVYCYNKSRNVTYAYDSFSYWDKDKKQPRSKRKLLGKLDPETGKIIPTGRKSTSRSVDSHSVTSDYKTLYQSCQNELEGTRNRIHELEAIIDSLKAENAVLKKAVSGARRALDIPQGGVL